MDESSTSDFLPHQEKKDSVNSRHIEQIKPVEKLNERGSYFYYSEEPPTLAEIIYPNNIDDYIKPLSQRTEDVIAIKENGELVHMSEKEVIDDLIERLNAYAGAAHVMGNTEAQATIENMIKPLRFMGNYETQKGIDGITARVAGYAAQAPTVLYLPEQRSDRWVTLNVLENLAKYDQSGVLFESIAIATSPEEAINIYTMYRDQHPKILWLDDHVLSGLQGQEFTGKIFKTAKMMGIPIDEIASAYEANIIAATYPHENRNDVYKGVYNDQGLHSFPYNIYCHYAVPPVQMDHRTIGSITSKDCIADFSFGDPLESVLKYLKSKLGGVLPPYISHLQKPYETEKDSGKFLNKEIQARWDTVVAKTGLPKQAESTS